MPWDFWIHRQGRVISLSWYTEEWWLASRVELTWDPRELTRYLHAALPGWRLTGLSGKPPQELGSLKQHWLLTTQAATWQHCVTLDSLFLAKGQTNSYMELWMQSSPFESPFLSLIVCTKDHLFPSTSLILTTFIHRNNSFLPLQWQTSCL